MGITTPEMILGREAVKAPETAKREYPGALVVVHQLDVHLAELHQERNFARMTQ